MKLFNNRIRSSALPGDDSDENLHNMKNNNSNSKSVHFNPTVQTISVISFAKKKKNRKSLWYSDEELKGIRAQATSLANMIKDGKTDDIPSTCMRGIEHLVMLDGFYYKNLAFSSVMEEQERQKQCDLYDPKKLSKAYRYGGASYCQNIAQIMGEQDHLGIDNDDDDNKYGVNELLETDKNSNKKASLYNKKGIHHMIQKRKIMKTKLKRIVGLSA